MYPKKNRINKLNQLACLSQPVCNMKLRRPIACVKKLTESLLRPPPSFKKSVLAQMLSVQLKKHFQTLSKKNSKRRTRLASTPNRKNKRKKIKTASKKSLHQQITLRKKESPDLLRNNSQEIRFCKLMLKRVQRGRLRELHSRKSKQRREQASQRSSRYSLSLYLKQTALKRYKRSHPLIRQRSKLMHSNHSYPRKTL